MDEAFRKRYIQARRAVIARDYPRLNDRQLQAALATEGPLLVLAGAGSGKTTVLIEHICNLLRYGKGSDSDWIPPEADQEALDYLEAVAAGAIPPDEELNRELCAVDPVDPWRIIAITFTNKAANELKSRLTARLGEGAGDVWAMTFHSACVRILRRDIEALGYSRSFTIYDSADSLSVMKRIVKDLQIDEKSFPPRSILAEISACKDRMITPSAYLDQAAASADLRKKQIGRAWVEYDRLLKEADALDFDDLILLTVKLLTQEPEVLAYYQTKFRYVLIDEYQDTDRLQYRLAALLSGGTSNLCVVGDDDQSIYKFRGATIENILQFEEQFPGARVIRLEQNYRSTGTILDAANSVISHNLGRKGKTLWTDRSGGEQIELHTALNDEDEARFVTNTIMAGAEEGYSFSDYAVLYRMNSQSNRLEFAFKRAGIPYKVYGGMRFYDRAEVKDMLAYLCVVANPSDDLRLLRILNNPPRGIGAKSIESAQAEAASAGTSLWAVISNAARYESVRRAAPRFREFAEMIEGLREQLDTLPLDLLYDQVLEKSGYLAMLQAVDSQENRTRAENVQELRSSILTYMNDAEDPSLFGFLEETALYSELDQMDETESAVTMMTIHSAKGLEFDTVFLVGMEDGIFPSLRTIGEAEEMEEERRLCYVAITRAKKKLILTCARQRMLYGRTSSNLPSRFIDEMPQELLLRTGSQRRVDSWYSGEDADDAYGTGDPFESSYRRSPDGGSYGRSYGNAYGGSYGSSIAGASRVPSGDRGWQRRESAVSPAFTRRTAIPAAKPASPAPKGPAKRPAVPTAEALAEYRLGDRVRHKAFGEGVIRKMTPAGTDCLIEVEFGGKLRKLMLKAAVPYMEKLENSRKE